MEDHIHALGPQTNQIGTFSFSLLRTSSGSTNIKTFSHFLFCSTQIQCFAYNGCLINFYQLNKASGTRGVLFLSREDSVLAVRFVFSISISLEDLWLRKDRELLSMSNLTRVL